jgi:hypothetical protein
MDVIEKLKQVIREDMRSMVPVQTIWATCKSANLQEGTMVAIADELEYYDVLLGLGGDLVEPMPDSRVLLGLVNNKREACVLLFAEATKVRHINGDSWGGLVKADPVATKLLALEQDLNTIKQLVTSWIPVPNDGGASLKAQLIGWSAQTIATTSSAELQNPKVKHG